MVTLKYGTHIENREDTWTRAEQERVLLSMQKHIQIKIDKSENKKAWEINEHKI